MKLYIEMYEFTDLVIEKNRLEDGYYLYDINRIIYKNRDSFCKKIWQTLNSKTKADEDILELYNCRCVQNRKELFCN